MVPSLAKSFAQKDFVNFSIIVKDNFITIFTIMSLTIPILIGSAAPLSDFFFSQGKVSSDALLLITNLIRIYGISLVGVILYLMFGFILLSSNKGKTFAFWGILAQLIVLCFNIFLVRKWGIYVFPISYGVGHLFTAIILSCFVIIQNKFNIYLSLLKYILVLFTISFLLYIFNLRHISEIPFIQLLANGFVIIFLFLIFSKFLDVNIVLLWKNVVSIFKKI
jgi:peptidoglycan biosynthesis protein MviN/MurJ (putative lipid II flippase)